MDDSHDSGWPKVGHQAPSATAHAANLKMELCAIERYVERNGGGLSVPYETFRNMSVSVQGLVDKVLGQTDLHDVAERLERIERNTEELLGLGMGVGSTIKQREERNGGGTSGSKLDLTTLGGDSRTMEMFKDQLEQIQDTPENTVHENLEAQKNRDTQLSEHQDYEGQLPVDTFVRAGPSSKIRLQDGSTEEVNVHEKIYSPLDKTKRQIRVVKISNKADPDFGLRVDFSVVSLDEQPVYTALSYTWGDGKDTIPIKVNGYRLDVTRNLKRALERLRTFGPEVSFWIDAICINQMDTDERTDQVRLMRQIYENPKQVIVYLGEPYGPNISMKEQTVNNARWHSDLFVWKGDESDLPRIEKVLRYVKAYGDSYPDYPNNQRPNDLMLAICFLRLLAGDVHLKDIPMLKHVHIQRICLMAFQNLVNQPWWNRIWVVQEVILPPSVTVIYERFVAPLQVYVDAARYLAHHRSACCREVVQADSLQLAALAEYCKRLMTIAEGAKLWHEKHNVSLPTLLRLYYPRAATDPRDKIYGLLGLVRDWGSGEPLVADYTISSARLYAETAWHTIAVSHTLDILSFRAEKTYDYYLSLEAIKKARLYHVDVPANAPPMIRVYKIQAMAAGRPEPIDLLQSSWATDWSKMTDAYVEVNVEERINRALIFNASAGHPAPYPSPLYTHDPAISRTPILCLTAYTIGKVPSSKTKDTGFTRSILGYSDGVIETSYKFPLPLRPEAQHLEEYVAGGTKYDAVCRALCADSWFIDPSSPSPSSTSHLSDSPTGTSITSTTLRTGTPNFRRIHPSDLPSIQKWRKWIQSAKNVDGKHIPPSPSSFTDTEEYTQVLAADRAIRAAGLGRMFVELDSGYVGMAGGAVTDDRVVVFEGGRTAFVVREVAEIGVEGGEGEEGQSRKVMLSVLIGEAYMTGGWEGEGGLMDGGFLDRAKREEKGERVYLI